MNKDKIIAKQKELIRKYTIYSNIYPLSYRQEIKQLESELTALEAEKEEADNPITDAGYFSDN